MSSRYGGLPAAPPYTPIVLAVLTRATPQSLAA
jgi:hypothetical protein